MLKVTVILRRKPGISHAEFVAYHREQHGPLFRSLPEVQKYVRRYVQVPSSEVQFPGMPDYNIDGSTGLWFDDLAGAAALFTHPNYLRHDTTRRREVPRSECMRDLLRG